MTAATPPLRPVLRLVYPPGYPGAEGLRGADPRDAGLYEAPVEVAPPPPARRVRAAAREIVRENRQAATISTGEAREIFAARVSEMLDGGRAAVLTPERRARAVRLARMLGVRDFDAHLMIAVVQDRARRGELEFDHRVDAPRAAPAPVGVEMRDDDAPARRFAVPASWTVAALQVAAAAMLAAALLLGVMNWLR